MDFSDAPIGSDMHGEFLVTVPSGAPKPDIHVEGDFAVHSLTKLDERTWQLCVALASLEGGPIRYGDVVVNGSWQGQATRIPITGSIRQN